jgi:hypothetical protein
MARVTKEERDHAWCGFVLKSFSITASFIADQVIKILGLSIFKESFKFQLVSVFLEAHRTDCEVVPFTDGRNII